MPGIQDVDKYWWYRHHHYYHPNKIKFREEKFLVISNHLNNKTYPLSLIWQL